MEDTQHNNTIEQKNSYSSYGDLEQQFKQQKNRFRPENTHKAKTKFDLFRS